MFHDLYNKPQFSLNLNPLPKEKAPSVLPNLKDFIHIFNGYIFSSFATIHINKLSKLFHSQENLVVWLSFFNILKSFFGRTVVIINTYKNVLPRRQIKSTVRFRRRIKNQHWQIQNIMLNKKCSPILFTFTILTIFCSKTLRYWVIWHKLKSLRCEKTRFWRKVCKLRRKNIFWALFFRETAVQFQIKYDELQNPKICKHNIVWYFLQFQLCKISLCPFMQLS